MARWPSLAKLPEAPQWKDYKDTKRTYTFSSRVIDAGQDQDVSFDLDQKFKFVGVVQTKDQPVYRVVFYSESTPFEVVQKDYSEMIEGLVAKATEAGETIDSLEDLEAWLDKDEVDANAPLDFEALKASMAKGQSEA